jgi:hypothetical protein
MYHNSNYDPYIYIGIGLNAVELHAVSDSKLFD